MLLGKYGVKDGVSVAHCFNAEEIGFLAETVARNNALSTLHQVFLLRRR